MGRFLRIFFGCHARADRSFFINGRQFPICARCTGELAGMLIGIPASVFFGCLPAWAVPLFLAPMFADGFTQSLTAYESTNGRRFITGLLFGVALITLFVYFHRTCVTMASAILSWCGMDAGWMAQAFGGWG